MARRKNELNTAKRSSKIASPSEGNVHVQSLTEDGINADDDGGNSSLDESGYEDTEMLKPEDITNIVIGDLKTVCVTKAASDDESDVPLTRASPNTQSETSKISSTNQPLSATMPIPTPNPNPPPCEHPKKKIVRLMSAAQYFNQDIVATINPGSMDGKVQSEVSSPTTLNVGIVKCNGELPVKEIIRTNSINSEAACDAISSTVPPIESPRSHHNEKHFVNNEETYSNRPMIESSSRQSAENNGIASVSEERDSYQDIDEILRKTAPFLRNLTSNLQQMNDAQFQMSENSLESTPTEVPTSETTQPPTQQEIEKILKDFNFSRASGANGALSNPPLSDQLASCALTLDSVESIRQTEKDCDKLETLDSKSIPGSKSATSITTFDFLSCERSSKRFTKQESVDQCVTTPPKATVSSKSSEQRLNAESSDKVKINSFHEELKTEVKSKKIEAKAKKMPKKVTNNKQSAKIADTKIGKDGREKSETKDAKEKRRRSTRLQSKPERDKYDDLNLLMMPSIVANKEKDTVTCDADQDKGKEDSICAKPSGKNGELISATISVEPAEMPSFKHIMDNEYHTERSFSKGAERMICDCVLTREDIVRGERGCGEDCLNRLLLIECCSRCTLGERCTNKRFQKKEYAKCEVFKTDKKGNGLRVLQEIPSGTFIMEYVGEVIDSDEFERRAVDYAHQKIPHFYFMSLKADCIIDATIKGNCSRFINHSCEPNAETQKWTVQGELRIGFFSKRRIKAGEEITFDYQLQRYGKQAQRCYCETPSCTGWIGEDPDKQQDNDKPTKEDKKKKKITRDQFVDLETALDEMSQVGLINRHQTLSLARLMVHAKELPVRMQILQLIEEGHPACRRLFLDYRGLPIIWSWMVDCTSKQIELKLQLLKTLMALPLTNRTILVDSKVLDVVEQWAFGGERKVQSEKLSALSVLESVDNLVMSDATPVSAMAQKALKGWSHLREAYRIPKKERIQQMKEHEREADEDIEQPRPRKLAEWAERIKESNYRRRHVTRDKEFERLYFDSWKRRDSPDNRDHHRKTDNSSSRISKEERRIMFEMQVAREKAEKEMLKRHQEEQESYWSLYYANQQHQMLAGGYTATGQYIPTMPPSMYSSDQVSQVVASQMMQSMSSIPSGATATASATHPYYPTSASSYMAQGMMLPHLPSTQASVPPQNLSPTAQSFYPSSATQASGSTANLSPTTAPFYPGSALYQNSVAPSTSSYASAELTTKPEKSAASAYTSYDYQMMSSPSDPDAGIASNNAYSSYNDGSMYVDASHAIADSVPATYATNDGRSTAVANVSTAAVDIKKIKLPPKWKAARDAQGCVYYYHKVTRISQWYPPTWDGAQPAEEAEQYQEVEMSDEDSSAEDDEDEASGNARRRRQQSYDEYETITKRRILGDADQNFDMDAELKENLAAMSCEFQDSDNDEYSPQPSRDVEQGSNDPVDEEQQNDNSSSPARRPLTTEHIISPREPLSREERMRNKRRIKSLKEKLRQQKRRRLHQRASGDGASTSGGAGPSGVAGPSGAAGSSSITGPSSIASTGGIGCSSSNSGGDGDVNSFSSSALSVPADTSSNTDRKRKDAFRSNMANFVVHCLNPYFRSSCTTARITNYGDFKHLARKLTHFVMLKELKHCRSATELTCNSSVKHKAKEYIRKYMSRFGETYERPEDDNTNY